MKKCILVISLALILGACSKPNDSHNSYSTERSAPMAEAVMDTQTKPSPDSLNSGILSQGSASHLQDKQLIISGDIRFKTANTLETLNTIEGSALTHGGYIQESSLSSQTRESRTYATSDNQIKELTLSSHYATVIVRVPKDKLGEFLKELRPLMNKLETRTFKAQDVTLDIYKNELQAQIEQQKQKTLDNIDGKGTLGDKADIATQSTLARHEALLYELEQKALQDKVTLSTIALNFYDEPTLSESIRPDLDAQINTQLSSNFGHELLGSIATGWYYFLQMVLWFVQLWGLWLIIGASIWGICRYRKHRKTKKATKPKPNTDDDKVNTPDQAND